MMNWVRTAVAIAVLVGMAIVVWKFKWVILSAALVITVGAVTSNAVYRKATGKELPIYTRMLKRGR